MTPSTCDVVVIGGGIVGLATAYALQQSHPGKRVMVVEKEDRVGAHQSSRNSGVIHSGIYYRPGSLKAINCRGGKRRMVEFCEQEGIAHEMCGKVIVAVDESERPGLQRILERSRANGIEAELIGKERLRELEPHARGVAAIYVREAGIADYGGVCRRLAEIIRERGGEVVLGAEVIGLSVRRNGVTVETRAGDVDAAYGVNCAGLYADRIARMSGKNPAVRVVPFRGEYFELKPERRSLCRNLIYPVPNPAFPFLGVHFTRMFDGRVECGPSAILATAREGYSRRDVVLRDMIEAAGYPGLLRLVARHWRTGIHEIRLPAIQPGSSIMPGKVNPVIPEVVNQVCFDVIGGDVTVTIAAEAGQLQLNAFEPVIAFRLLRGLEMLRRACLVLRERCVTGISPNVTRMRHFVEHSIGIVTALVPIIGYETATEIAKTALESGRGVFEVVLERGVLTRAQLDEILDPAGMLAPRSMT